MTSRVEGLMSKDDAATQTAPTQLSATTRVVVDTAGNTDGEFDLSTSLNTEANHPLPGAAIVSVVEG